MAKIVQLAAAQLDAYNRADLDAFVECYHPDVIVFDGQTLLLEGRAAFRARYESLFSRTGFGADVHQRMSLGRHCIDAECWWRLDGESGVRRTGHVLVRYRERDGFIDLVQFLSEQDEA